MKLTQQRLEAHLWGAADILRGKTAGQDYKNYILSLLFYKRLCDQWDNEVDDDIARIEQQRGVPMAEEQRAVFRKRGEHRYAIPDGCHWGDVKAVATNIGRKLTDAMRGVAAANDELNGVFTVDWAADAPDGKGKTLIPNGTVHALVQHFDEVNLSNQSVPADVLGRAYEYLIKKFADDAGAKAGEFFTPPEVVDALVRMLEPVPGDTIYDPTCGSGGMLVHAADYLRESGHRVTEARYFGQELNWGNYAIAKINSVLHGLEAQLVGGQSTIADPGFLNPKGGVQQFSLVMANFPFSDEFWWLPSEQHTDDKKKRDKLKKEVFGKDAPARKGRGAAKPDDEEAESATADLGAGYNDPHRRFGRGTAYASPPASNGDYAFLLHILASTLEKGGRAGVVCPQGVLFRGQAEVEEETDELDAKGQPKIKRRKADDEHRIRRGMLDSELVEAIIALPANIFYGAGVPACLVIMRRQRPATQRGKVLLVYAARHYRELSAQNELRPQDVMRLLVHYHAYGEAERVPALVATHTGRLRDEITRQEETELERLEAEYREHAEKLARLDTELAMAQASLRPDLPKGKRAQVEKAVADIEKKRALPARKVAERDEKQAEARRRAEEDRQAVTDTGHELGQLYADPEGELLKHVRVVERAEIEENEFNLNIPRYVDTFEPEPVLEVTEALRALRHAEQQAAKAERKLQALLQEVGYAV